MLPDKDVLGTAQEFKVDDVFKNVSRVAGTIA